MDGWMDGVVLIRCIDRWIAFFSTFAVGLRWFPTLFFQGVFRDPSEHSFSRFWLPPGSPADPEMMPKTSKIGLGGHAFPLFVSLDEICTILVDF